MAKQFYVWKDPACNGINPEWLELTGVEFYRFIKAPENKGRFFVTLGDDGDEDAGIIVIEATPDCYRSWYYENRRSQRHLKRNIDLGYTICSLSAPVTEDEECLLSDTVAVDDVDFVEEILLREDVEKLHRALATLTEAEMRIVNALYLFNTQNLSEREVARRLGIQQMTMNRWKKKILKKLEKFMFQN